MPVRRGELRRHALEVFDDRNAVQEGDGGHRLRVIQGEPQGDIATPVVAGDREPIVSQRMHDLEHVCGDGTLAVRGVVGRRRRPA